MERRKTSRGVSMFVRIKDKNLEYVKKRAKQEELSLSFFIDRLIDSMRKKKK